MVPELKDLTDEETQKEMELPTLHARRERGELITMYKIVNRIDKIDKQDLVVLKEDDGGRMRGHSKRIRKRQCLSDIKTYSFPHRTVNVWNGLSEEIVTAASVQKFKEMLDIYRYGDRTI